jgi:hypothetical protein
MTSMHHTPALWAWLLSGLGTVTLAGACHLYDETLLEPLNGDRDLAAPNGTPTATQADAATVGITDSGSGGRTHDRDARDAAVPLRDAGSSESNAGAVASAGFGSAAGGGGNAGKPGVAPTDLDGGDGLVSCSDADALMWIGNGHCYFPLAETNTWFVSRDRCNELGAHLVTIGSAPEQAFVNELVGSTSRWIGLARFGAPAFTWVDGEQMTFENWESGAPKLMSEAAAVIRSDTCLWFDDSVKNAHPPLCERE